MLNQQSRSERNSTLPDASTQVKLLEETDCGILPFASKIAASGSLPLRSGEIEVLQINTGYRCNLLCRHCHVDAGPDRTEMMTRQTMQHCLEAIKRGTIKTIDITGGAPEMNPEFRWFIESLRRVAPEAEIIVRSNLTLLLAASTFSSLGEFLKEHRITIIASLPCYTKENVDLIRGKGVFDRSIEALKRLNLLGYAKKESNLELNLVYNPGGPSLPACQAQLEAEYRSHLMEEHGIHFSHLYTITNMPVSRFLGELLENGSYCRYMNLLEKNFNPLALETLMCRTTLSVGWDGALYDCDFNQMLHLPLRDSAVRHISQFSLERLQNRQISLGQHCYGCTAGAGSSCQGSLL